MKFSCLIADDEPKALELLEKYINQVPFLELKHTCYDAFEAFEKIGQHQPDLVFLDINMPQLSGIELASMLPREQALIFTTAYSEFALKGYEFNAIDYLLKPFSFERFVQAATKGAAYLTKKPPVTADQDRDHIFIKTGKEIVQLNLNDLVYFEGSKEYITIHSLASKHMIYKRMKELETELPAHFARIHQSYIINTRFIQKIEQSMVLIKNTLLPISSGYKDRFFEHLKKNML